MRPAPDAVWLLLPLLSACGGMAIDGQVVDSAGTAVPGASVTVVSTPCNGTAADDGKFSIQCPPGTYELIIAADGYTTLNTKVDANERKRYDIGKQVLLKIPDVKGLYLFVDGTYQLMKPGRLGRTLQETAEGLTRSYCLDQDHSEVNSAPAGEMPFFDNQYDGWRPFRLDDEGCAYRDVKGTNNKWQVTYKDKPEYDEVEVQQGMKLARIDLQAGQYFVADWKQGFFTSSEDDKHSYTGFWLQVR